MTSARWAVAAAGLAAVLLAACSSPEERAARVAERMNSEDIPKIASVRAEGPRLIVRYDEMDTGALSDDELKRMMVAGLCQIDGVADFIQDGGAIRLEVPRNFDYFPIDIDGCES